MSQDRMQMRDGGRGLKIISLIADRLEYTRMPDRRNCLFIVKHYCPTENKGAHSAAKPSWKTWWKRLITQLQPSKQPVVADSEGKSPLQVIQLVVSSDLNALEEVLSWYDGIDSSLISNKVWLQCQLALVEGFTNAVRHAHKDLPTDTLVDLEIKRYANFLEIRIWDRGHPFDLIAKLEEMGNNEDELHDSPPLNQALAEQLKSLEAEEKPDRAGGDTSEEDEFSDNNASQG